MKSILILLSCLAVFGGSSALAAPPAVQKPWVTPRAQPVIDRAKAAYATIEGWSASIVLEDHWVTNGVEKTWFCSMMERYLKGDGSPGFYSFTSTYIPGGSPTNIRFQNSEGAYRMDRAPNISIRGKATAPDDMFNQPSFERDFLLDVGGAQYVRYGGQEQVNGQACDIVETVTVTVTPATPDQPEQPASVASVRYYVDPAGFVVRMVTVSDDFPRPAPAVAGARVRPLRTNWGDWRVTRYDAKAKPAKEEFSRAAFDRVAATMLWPGEVMPDIPEELFKRTESLPDVSFIAWEDKKPFRLADLKGKVVVLETWASWCHFCKEAFPYYEKMRQQLAAQDVVFVAISFDGKVADYEKWMNAHGADYGFKFGRIDAPNATVALKDFRGNLPAFYVLGRDGRIISGYSGYAYNAGDEDPRLLAALREAGVKL